MSTQSKSPGLNPQLQQLGPGMPPVKAYSPTKMRHQTNASPTGETHAKAAKSTDVEMTDGPAKSVGHGIGGDVNANVNEATPSGHNRTGSSSSGSSSRRERRAASISQSPKAGRGLGSKPLSFGAGLTKVPPPIITNPIRQQQMIGNQIFAHQAGKQSLPAIKNVVGEEAIQLVDSARPSGGKSINMTGMSPMNQQRVENPQVAEVKPAHVQQMKNPYHIRADEIGLNHGIPGIGSLRALLTPLGWKGPEPITEAQAVTLYENSRRQAEHIFHATADEFNPVPQPMRDQMIARKVEAFERLKLIDELVVSERVKIARAFIHHQQKLAALFGGEFRVGQDYPVSRPQVNLPTPLGLQMQGQDHNFQGLGTGLRMDQRLNQPGFANSIASPPLSAGLGFHGINGYHNGLQFPQAPPISPSQIDPALIPQTFQSALNIYNTNSRILQDLANENETFLRNWDAKFNTPTFRMNNGHQGLSLPQALAGNPMGTALKSPSHYQQGGQVTQNLPFRGQHAYFQQNGSNSVLFGQPQPQATTQLSSSGTRSLLPAAHVVEKQVQRPNLGLSFANSSFESASSSEGKRPSTQDKQNINGWCNEYKQMLKKHKLPKATISKRALTAAGVNTQPKNVRVTGDGETAGRFAVSGRAAQALIACGATQSMDQAANVSNANNMPAANTSSAQNHAPYITVTLGGDRAQDQEMEVDSNVENQGGVDGHGKADVASESTGLLNGVKNPITRAARTRSSREPSKSIKRAAPDASELPKKRTRLNNKSH